MITLDVVDSRLTDVSQANADIRPDRVYATSDLLKAGSAKKLMSGPLIGRYRDLRNSWLTDFP